MSDVSSEELSGGRPELTGRTFTPKRIGCAALVVVVAVVISLLVYADNHADQSPQAQCCGTFGTSQTFTQAPEYPATGSGATTPPNAVFGFDTSVLDLLTVQLSSSTFTWVPAGVVGPVQPFVRQEPVPGGCPTAPAPGTLCPSRWSGQYPLSTAGTVTIRWDLLALAPPTSEVGSVDVTSPPTPDRACPAHLPVPLTPAVAGCVVATETIDVTVSADTFPGGAPSES